MRQRRARLLHVSRAPALQRTRQNCVGNQTSLQCSHHRVLLIGYHKYENNRFSCALQVGAISVPGQNSIPGDFMCYRRAESLPAQPYCPPGNRATLLANATHPAAASAAQVAAGLAMSAALLQVWACLSTRHWPAFRLLWVA